MKLSNKDIPLIFAFVAVLAIVLAIAITGTSVESTRIGLGHSREVEYPWWQYSGAWIALFTIALTVSSAGLWWITWRALRHSQRDSARQARDMLETLSLTRKQFIATHRPKLIVRLIQLGNLVPEKPVEIWLTVANVGASDAIIESIRADIATKGWANISWDVPGIEAREIELGNSKLASGEQRSFPANHNKRSLSLARTISIQQMGSRFYFLGEIVYRDENGTTRRTGFVRWFDTQFSRFSNLPSEWVGSELEYAD